MSQNYLELPRLNLSGRELYDLDLLLVDAFLPLKGFMTEAEYLSVLHTMRLPDGQVFPMPVVLSVPPEFPYDVGQEVLLCDGFGNPHAILTVTSRFRPDKKAEAEAVFGTNDKLHPGVAYLMQDMKPIYLGGTLQKIALKTYTDFTQYRYTPSELKRLFKQKGWNKVVGFQTRNPMHRSHFELVKRAHEMTGAAVLLHPVVGMTKPGDIDYVTRVRTYSAVANTYGKAFMQLALLPLAMRMGGPREAVWHALIRKNYGCTHFIVGRDHAGPGVDSNGKPFYAPYAARELAESLAPEIGITLVSSDELVYSKTRQQYVSAEKLAADEEVETISGTEFRRLLRSGEAVPPWFSFPEVVEIMNQGALQYQKPGVAILFTGLSGAGKTTIAQELKRILEERQQRQITFLDGDEIRRHLSKGLGFSKEDREENVRRVGFVASEVVRHGGIALLSLIAPYVDSRAYVRSLVSERGVFVEVYVATPVSVCEARDTKGLYKKARSGEIKNFTGIDDPYESPVNPEIVLHTEARTPEACALTIMTYLETNSLI